MVQSFQMTISWMSPSIHFDQAVVLERGESPIRVMTHTALKTKESHIANCTLSKESPVVDWTQQVFPSSVEGFDTSRHQCLPEQIDIAFVPLFASSPTWLRDSWLRPFARRERAASFCRIL